MTLGSHQRCVGKSQVHLTPKWLIDALGPFDLDPCAATGRPWDCAKRNYVEAEDGLAQPWEGMVWLNPPFDRYEVGKWLQRLGRHDNGIILTHARTEAAWFRPIWHYARLIVFLDKRIKFCRPDGTEQPANSGAPLLLAAFGPEARDRLREANLSGAYVERGVGLWVKRNAIATGTQSAETRSKAQSEGCQSGAKAHRTTSVGHLLHKRSD